MKGKTHILLRDLDRSYCQALCGEVLPQTGLQRLPKYGFLDWKPAVNCQSCLQTAFELMDKKAEQKGKRK